MKKSATLLLSFLFFCFSLVSLSGQHVRHDIIVSFANSELPMQDIQLVKDFAEQKNVIITELEKLECIPFTFWWALEGDFNDVIETVDYIKTRPRGASNQKDTTRSNSLNHVPSYLPPTCDEPKDSVDAYFSCDNRAQNGVLMAVIDDGMGQMFGNERNPIEYKAFFDPYLWSDPATGSIGYSFVNNTPDVIDDRARHGSAITYRIVDMLRKARIDNVKVMVLQTHDPETGIGTLWNVCRALDFAYCRNAQVINMSIAGLLSNPSPVVDQEHGDRRGEEQNETRRRGIEKEGTSVLEVVMTYMGRTKGTLMVAAAGNDGEDVTRPRADLKRYCTASYQIPNLIEVAANAACSDELWQKSNFGAPNVHIAAPGEAVYCAVPIKYEPSGIEQLTGTSLAAPHVAAAAAILAANRLGDKFDYASIVESLTDPSITPAINALRGLVSSGGRLNTCKALNYFISKYASESSRENGSNTDGTERVLMARQQTGFDIAPNPIQTGFTMRFVGQQEAEAEWFVTDVLGRNLVHQKWGVNKGENTLSVDASGFNKGVYIVTMRVGEQIFLKKVIKNE